METHDERAPTKAALDVLKASFSLASTERLDEIEHDPTQRSKGGWCFWGRKPGDFSGGKCALYYI